MPDAKIYAQYISFSYGLSNRLELTVGGMGGVQSSDKFLSLMNPLLQLKAKIFDGCLTDAQHYQALQSILVI